MTEPDHTASPRRASPPATAAAQRLGRWLANLPLATKTAALVGLTGTLSAVIAISAMLLWQSVDARYYTRLNQETQNTLQLATVAVYLSDATREILSIPATQEQFDQLQVRQQLLQIQMDLHHELSSIARRSPELALEIEFLDQRAQRLFLLGHAVVDAALANDHELTQGLIERNFTPAMRILRQDIERLQYLAQQLYTVLGQAQLQARQEAIVLIILAVVSAICLVSALSAASAVRWISQPIAQMTRSMQRLLQRDYHLPPLPLQRQDEVGTMAMALQGFRDSMLHSEMLSTQVLQAQASQLLSEQLLELTSAVPVAIFQLHLTPQGHSDLRFVTPRWEAVVRHALTPWQEPALWQLITHSVQSLEPIAHDLLVAPPRVPTATWFKILANTKQMPDGSVLFNGGWLDITQEKTQSLALAHAKQAAETAAQEQSRFLATISHEIRTPLNAMLGMTQLLQRSPLLHAQQQQQLDNLDRAGRLLRSLANDVLDFSKLDAQRVTLEHTVFALDQVIDDVRRMCQEDLHAKGLQLDCKVDPRVPAWLHGDPYRLTQALLNLVHNAIKFTAQGRIRIRVAILSGAAASQVLLRWSVTDTGPGLSRADAAQLFRPFFQVDASISRRFGGTGLGLAIVHRLAQLMHGKTGLHSRPGRGSCFWFTTVLSAASPPGADAAASTLPAIPALPGRRLLLVDDHPLNLEVLQGFLRPSGAQLDCCSDGVFAWEQLLRHAPRHYDVILIDLQMPQLDGWSFCRRLRAHPHYRHLPVLAMTAHTRPEDMRHCQEVGMNGLVAKPIVEAALWEALLRTLGDDPTATQPAHSAPALAPAALLPTDTALAADFAPAALQVLRQHVPGTRLDHLVQQFRSDLQHRLTAMEQAQDDLALLRQQAHLVAGSVATFGLERLGQLACQLVDVADAADLQGVITLLPALQASARNGLAQLHAALQADSPQAQMDQQRPSTRQAGTT